MKTIYEIVKEYNERNEANTTPIHGFRVGDKVKTTPEYNLLVGYKKNGTIIKVSGEVVIFEMGHKGSHNIKTLNEYWLMSDN